MKIGIDISQLAYQNTGVANLLEKLIENMLKIDKTNEYVLFFSSMRRDIKKLNLNIDASNVKIKSFKYPPRFLDLLWNKLHIFPIEQLIGDVDVFITSDWTEPPTRRAKKVNILYDLVIYKYPEETSKKIVETQKRKLKWAVKESSMFLCISRSTLLDAKEILKIDEGKLNVVYPGFSL